MSTNRDDLLERLVTGDLEPDSPEALAALAADAELARHWRELQAVAAALRVPGSATDAGTADAFAREGDRIVAMARQQLLRRRRRTVWPWLLAASIALAATWAMWPNSAAPQIAPASTTLSGNDQRQTISRSRSGSGHDLLWADGPRIGRYTVQIGERQWQCSEPRLHLTAQDLASMPDLVECKITWNSGTARQTLVLELEFTD